MGEGSGIYYSPASFIAHALNDMINENANLQKEWLSTKDMEIEGFVPGNKQNTSIWAWKIIE